MIFSSGTFLYAFLPLTLIFYFMAPKSMKNPVLLIASLIFYGFGEPIYVTLLVFSSVFDWMLSLIIEKHRGKRKAKMALWMSVIGNLSLLGFFKYADFFIQTFNAILGTSVPQIHVALPVGISFFTFQTMSYTIDVYRGRVHAQKNLVTLATFVCLFPQLIAGPIVRYADIEGSLQERKVTLEMLGIGIRRFIIGLGKKVLIANMFGEICARYNESMEKTVLFAWMYAIAFMLQIYFDFSGYSDMAIGLGKMFGFHFPENFDYPYLSKSVTEFWRRWHMTLGSWFRDYVYIPLGGNRTSKGKWLRNLLVVWFLTGLWHGASWNFVLWGCLFGFLLVVEKLWLYKRLERLPGVLRHGYVLLLVMVSFVIFNGETISGAMMVLKQMVGIEANGVIGQESLYYLRSYGVIYLLGVLGSTRIPKKIGCCAAKSKISWWLEPVFMMGILFLVTASIVDGSFNPFLYFRF